MVKSMSIMLRAGARFVGVLSLCVSAAAWAAPSLLMEQQDEVVLVPIGSVVTNTIIIENSGDSTMSWTLSERFEGKVIRDFENPWTSAKSMRYDATRDCLWLSYYPDSNVKKVSPTTGAVLATKNMGSNCTRPYAIEIENGYLWAPDYESLTFKKFNLGNMSVADTVPFPSGWTVSYGIAIGDGQLYATESSDRNDLYRLNPSTGAILTTHDEIDYFYYYRNHISYGLGGVWFGTYYTPRNQLQQFDPDTVAIRRVIEMPDWYESMYICDQSVMTDGQAWVLTYRHDYHETGLSKYWIHLVDSAAAYITESADSGTVGAGTTESVEIAFDGRDASSSFYTADIKVSSDGGSGTKPYTIVFHTPGDNTAPTADAGANQTMTAAGPTTEVTLDGTGSSDPDNDALRYTWTEMTAGGQVTWATSPSATIDLPPGVHDITLTVDDLRGGTDTDTVRITLRAPDIAVDDVFAPAPEGSGLVTALVTVVNNGDLALDWSVSETLTLGQDDIIREFAVNWMSSYSSYAYPRTMTYDATRDCLWVGYYYDDEIGKLNPNTGATITTKALGSTHRIYALDMDGADLWIADYNAKNFKSFNPDTATAIDTISSPGSWTYGPSALARDSGEFYAAEYYRTNLYRLNPSTGGIQATHPTDTQFRYHYNHIDAIDGTVWYSPYNAPRNRLFARDGSTGNLLKTFEIDGWDGSSGYIYDLSFAGTNTQCWLLTSNVKGDGQRWAHLLDLSGARGTTKSATSGTVAAGSSNVIEVVMDVTGLPIGLYPVTLTFASNDPDEPTLESEVSFLVHEDAPNNPPVADAGPDVIRTIYGASAPFILELEGGGSSDPDGDPLKLTWTWTSTGEPVETGENGLVNLGPGAHGFTLTVEDYRGGVDTDEMVFTVEKRIPNDWRGWHGTYGTGHACETNENWLQNWPPKVKWIYHGIGQGISCPVYSDGRVYICSSPGIHCVDAETGEQLWTGSFYVGDANPYVDDKYVYAGTNGKEGDNLHKGKVYCFDKVTGSNIWVTGEIGPGYGADSAYSSEYGAISALGDVVFYGRHALNRYTGATLWTGYRTVHWKPFDWQSTTYMMCGANGYLYNPVTGTYSLDVGPSVRNGEGWYANTQTHGTNKVWTIDEVWEVGGSKFSDFGDVGVVTYTQPFTIGDDGYFIAGGHCGGGTAYHVDMNTGAKTSLGVRLTTATAVRDSILGPSGGSIILVQNSPTGWVSRPYNFDSRTTGYGEAIYAEQKIFVMCADGLACLYTGLAAPSPENRDAVYDHGSGNLTFSGWLENTGGRPTEGTVYWGPSDGGTNALAWAHSTSAGAAVRGPMSAVTADAPADTLLFYRWYAENDRGGTWAPGVCRVSTHAPTTVEGSDGLLLHWPLDETSGQVAHDVSGGGRHGTLDNDFDGTEWTNGIFGGALYFPNVRNSVAHEGPFHTPLETEWSVCFWARIQPDAGGPLLTLSEFPWGHASWPGCTVAIKLDQSRIEVMDRSTTHGHGPADDMRDGQWHHLACTYEDGVSRLFIDGAERSAWGVAEQVYRAVTLGGLTWSGGMKYVDMDDVRTYARRLTQGEIATLWRLGNGTETDLAPVSVVDANDAEEASTGTVTLDGNTLNLGTDGAGDACLVGLRFTGVDIPRYAAITDAQVQFGAAESDSEETVLKFQAHDIDSAPAFSTSAGDLSGRARTTAAVSWVCPAWTAGAQGADQCSPNLAGVIQEVVDRPGWTNGNAIAFLVSGTGRRVAEAKDGGSGLEAALTVQWSDVVDVDGDSIPDAYERATALPSGTGGFEDADGDGETTWGEYIAGTDASDPASVPRVSLRVLPDGSVVADVDALPPEPPLYPEGAQRYYTLEHCTDLMGIAGTGTVSDLWYEDFNLPDGTDVDEGDTAWTIRNPGVMYVTNGYFWARGIGKARDCVWESETISTLGRKVDVSVDIRSEGPLDGGDYIRVYYSLDGGDNQLLAERYDNFNGNAWETVSISGLEGMTIRIIVKAAGRHGNDLHFWDNVRVQTVRPPDWPCVPGMSNIVVDSACTLSHTNITPGKTGFYRLKVGLE